MTLPPTAPPIIAPGAPPNGAPIKPNTKMPVVRVASCSAWVAPCRTHTSTAQTQRGRELRRERVLHCTYLSVAKSQVYSRLEMADDGACVDRRIDHLPSAPQELLLRLGGVVTLTQRRLNQ